MQTTQIISSRDSQSNLKCSYIIFSFGNRVRISSLLNPQITPLLLNKTVTVCGWIRTTRVLGKGDYLFAEVNDGSCVKHLQVVVLKHIDKFDELKNEGIGSSVRFKGVVVQSQGSKQSVELLYNC